MRPTDFILPAFGVVHVPVLHVSILSHTETCPARLLGVGAIRKHQRGIKVITLLAWLKDYSPIHNFKRKLYIVDE